jgi:hypothetical protein
MVAQLGHPDDLPAPAHALLQVEDRAPAGQLDADGRHEHEGQEHGEQGDT